MSNARNIAALSTVEVGATADQTKADIEGLGIAASSVTGALPAIDGGALTGDVGKVLQVVTMTPSPSYSLSGSGTTSIPEYSYTLTKKQNNSKVVGFITHYNYPADSSCGSWYLDGYANGVSIVTNSTSGAILTHNQLAYTFNQGAHQTYSGMWEDTTNAATVAYTFNMRTTASGVLNIWGVKHMVVYMEIGQ